LGQRAQSEPLPQRIKAAREILRLTRGEIAKRWGFSRRSLIAWKEGIKSRFHFIDRQKLERNLRRIEG
jgi:DNA-binding transcriptional regulator YiaG